MSLSHVLLTNLSLLTLWTSISTLYMQVSWPPPLPTSPFLCGPSPRGVGPRKHPNTPDRRRVDPQFAVVRVGGATLPNKQFSFTPSQTNNSKRAVKSLTLTLARQIKWTKVVLGGDTCMDFYLKLQKADIAKSCPSLSVAYLYMKNHSL